MVLVAFLNGRQGVKITSPLTLFAAERKSERVAEKAACEREYSIL
jgi:hypothetical protein